MSNDSLFLQELDDVEKWALEHTKYTRFRVNYDYHGVGKETFWQGAGGAAYRFAAGQAGARHFANGIWYVLPEEEANDLITLFQTCPGWNDEADPTPHTVIKIFEDCPGQDLGAPGASHPVEIEEGLTREKLIEDAREGR